MKKFLGLLAIVAFLLFAATASTSATASGHTPGEVVYADVGLSPPATAALVTQAEISLPTTDVAYITQTPFTATADVNVYYETDVGSSLYPADLNNSNYKIKSWLLMFQSKHPPGAPTSTILSNTTTSMANQYKNSFLADPTLFRCDRARYV